MKTQTFPLIDPIEHELAPGGRIESVTLRRAKAKDMERLGDHLPALSLLAPEEGSNEPNVKNVSGAVFTALIELVSCIGDLPVEVVREMDFEDLTNLGTEAQAFLSVRNTAGGNSLPNAPIS